jgi:hypothetical protein
MSKKIVKQIINYYLINNDWYKGNLTQSSMSTEAEASCFLPSGTLKGENPNEYFNVNLYLTTYHIVKNEYPLFQYLNNCRS